MIRKLKRNRATAVKTKFDIQIVSLSIPAVPKMKEITRGDHVRISLERNGKIVTSTDDVTAAPNQRDNGMTLKFANELSVISTMYRDTSNTKYIEKKAKLLVQVNNPKLGKYQNVGDSEVLLDEFATIYDNSTNTLVGKTFSVKNCSVPGAVLVVKYTVSSIGKDDAIDNALETDTVISDATLDSTFEDVDLQDRDCSSSNSPNIHLEELPVPQIQVL